MVAHVVTTDDGPDVSIDGSGTWNGESINPNDTFLITGGTYDTLTLNNVRGTSGNTINFENLSGEAKFTGGTSSTSIHFQDNNAFIKFLGNGVDGTTYGFRCEEKVFRIRHRADDIEIGYVHRIGLTNRTIGFQTKQDNSSAAELSNIEYHHCRCDKVTEGWYNGDTGSSLTTSQYRLSNIITRDSIIDDCYDGVQHNRDFGTSQILRNIITNAAPGTQSAYNGAIVIGHEMGDYTIDSNYIEDCDGFGINAQNANDGGSGDIALMQNNVIWKVGHHVSSGRNDAIKVAGGNLHQVIIRYNTIIEVGVSGAGQGVNQSNMNSGCLVDYYGNIMLDIEGSTVLDTSVTPRTNTHNHTDNSTGPSYTRSGYGFVDEVNGDFRLTGASPAINAGPTGQDIPTLDILGRLRGNSPSIGAYEIGALLLFT